MGCCGAGESSGCGGARVSIEESSLKDAVLFCMNFVRKLDFNALVSC